MKHLRFDYREAFEHGENRHARKMMKDLGIEYTHSTPQSLGDQYWFWNCTNIPEKLPVFITELKLDPMKQIGWGISEKEANEIVEMGQ